ncbi:ER membrane protein complex subunit 2-like [Lineus longissimus]|uniref:ER membrane protein complex subunit 2-like n=1 Tax=Lineus longissimus TaxID=88925 RepID=UPI002B4F46C6
MACILNWEDARAQLKKMRDENIRDSAEVVDLWDRVLFDFSYKLGDEIWIVYEQVCIAAMDTANFEVADYCLEALQNQFPNSLRIRKLIGMKLEALDRYDEAVLRYKAVLEEDETNSVVRKRIIAVLKAQNKIPEAIKELNKYLELYMADYEGWMELCDLYLAEMDYAKASFCLEELILSNAHNHLYHQKYAEIKYTQGGADNMGLAQTYFSQAAKLNPNNMRALFGLFMAATNLATTSKNSRTRKDSIKYAAWAAEQISAKYQGRLPEEQTQQVNALESMLTSLQITQTGSG